MIQRTSRHGPFLGCSNYPKCRTTLKIDAEANLLPDQEFACTYNESAGKKSSTAKNGARKNGASSSTVKKPTTTKKTTTTKRAK